MAVLLTRNDREYLVTPGDELQTDLGIATVPEDVSPGDTITTHLGNSFSVRALRGPDLFHHFERTGSPMVPRDIGLILAETGIDSSARVLDVGTGTGVLSAYMGRLGATVISYERNEEFAQVARENMELADVSDVVTVRTADAVDEIDTLLGEPPFTTITLDTQNAASIIESVPDLLDVGGFLATYSPFVESAREAASVARDVGLSDVTTWETIQRRMDFDERGSRPTTGPVGHTGYILIARKA